MEVQDQLDQGKAMTENPQDQTSMPQQPDAVPPPPPTADPPPAYSQVPAYGQAPAYSQQGQAPVSPSDARMWSLFAHLGGVFLSFLVPLVIYLVYKDRDPFVRRHAAQALNFQIILAIIYFVSSLLIIVLVGLVMLPAAFIASVVFSIMAAIAANDGREYTYPLTPKMIS